MIKVKTLAALALGLALAACATSGTKVDQAQMSQFHKGTTTYTDVVNTLGEPNQTGIDGNGNKTATYIYTHSNAKAQSFIPVVGLFAGGANVENSVATFTFNQKGVLTKMSQSQGKQDVKTGIAQ